MFWVLGLFKVAYDRFIEERGILSFPNKLPATSALKSPWRIQVVSALADVQFSLTHCRLGCEVVGSLPSAEDQVVEVGGFSSSKAENFTTTDALRWQSMRDLPKISFGAQHALSLLQSEDRDMVKGTC